MTPLPGLLLALLIVPVAAPADAVQESDIDARTRAAREVAAGFARRLGAALKAELAKGDPGAAMAVCSEMAPAMAAGLSRETGWRVTRVGTRVRNPLLGMPDAWEQETLRTLATRLRAGEDPARLEHAAEVDEPGGRYLRYAKALVIAPPCLTCHGSKEAIPRGVRDALAVRYPHDAATGYALGDLRGMISIKQPLEAVNAD